MPYMKLIYFHGFGSSAQSGTIRTLREQLPDFEVVAIDNFTRMEEHQFDGATPVQKDMVWGLFASDDKQVNGEHIFTRYYNNVIHFEGEHRMDDNVITNVLIPLIRRITHS